MKYLYLVWSNLKRKKLRTLLTLLSILVAFILFGYLSAIRQAFNAGITVAGADRLVVRHKVSIIQMLPEAYEGRMEQIAGVDNAVHMTWFGGVYQKPSNFFAQIVVRPEEMFDMWPEYVVSEEHRKAWLDTRSGAIAGRQLVDRFGWKVGDRVPIQGTAWQRKDGNETWEFDLVGVYEPGEKGTDDTQFFFRYDFFEESRLWGSGMVGWYTVRIADPDAATEVASRIDTEFANSPQETKTEPEGAFIQGFANQVGDIGLIMTAIVAAVFFTILLVAGNTMAYAVRERTNELAVLKAVGFTDRGVLGLVLGESFALAGVGGMLGLALSVLLVSFGDPTKGSLPVFFIPTRDIVIGILLIGVMAVVAGILPALQAQRLRIADALRR
ncbi:MAG: FtsX-like permease family protein [Xanthomonadales bacterium]|nr:FtsX-like permease family protein [Xanthomonadales bacterium]NIX13368.1 FtsX-like permease family protein [Xanthomonadales bacterium]